MSGIAAALGIGGLASNLLTNYSNQANNDRNYELAIRQQRFAEQSFNRQMRFNSPVTQANLLRAAGMNPALMNSGLAGSVSAGSSGGMPSNTPLVPLDLTGLNGVASNLGLLDAQKRMLEEEGKAQSIDNLFKKEDWLSKLYGRDSQSWLNNKMADIAGLSFQYDKESMSDRLKSLRLDNELKDANVAAQTITLQYLTPRLAAEINNLVAQQFVAYATGRASLTQAHAAIMNATTNNEEMKAKFGSDPDSRRQYSLAVYRGLLQERNKMMSEEWKNIHTVNPLPYNRFKEAKYFDWRDNNHRWD